MKATIHVLDNQHGYVWDAAEAHWLRLEYGLVGATVGGVAGFKQQNAVHGLPLQLSADEVTLALERGWAVLLPAPSILSQAAALGSRKRAWRSDDGYGGTSEEEEQPAEQVPLWKAALSRSAPFTVPIAMAPALIDAGGERSGAASPGGLPSGSSSQELLDADPALGRSRPAAAAAPLAAASVPGGDLGVDDRSAAASGDKAANGEGQGAGRAAAAAADAGTAAAATGAAGEVVRWCYPATQEERHRYWVFRDLHQSGYRITGGSKFGADFLVYPGDPTLFHAQFCVRLLPYRGRILPALLAAAARGSHQARKHLLLASVVEEEESDAEPVTAARLGPASTIPAAAAAAPLQPAAATTGDGVMSGQRCKIRYITIGPGEGFG